MNVRQTSRSDLLADEKLVSRFYDLLAAVDEEELREIFHDFIVPATIRAKRLCRVKRPGHRHLGAYQQQPRRVGWVRHS